MWETYKSQLEIKTKTLERNEEDISYQLYNWMCLAVRLDTMSRGNGEGVNTFDKEKLYELLVKEQIHYAEWPKLIIEEVERCKVSHIKS